MRHTSRTTHVVHTLATATLLGALLTACAARTSDLPGLTASPTATASPTPTPSPEAIQETSDPDLGIVFEDVPDLTGAEADVYDAVATFEKEYWRMMTTNTVSPAFAIIASPEITATMQQIADQNAGVQLLLGGVFHSTISDVTVNGDTATASTCDDYNDVTGVDPNGTYTSQEVGLVNVGIRLTLAPSPTGGWRVTTMGESTRPC